MSKQDSLKSLVKPFGWVAVLADGTKAAESAGAIWSEVKDKVVSLSIEDAVGNLVAALPSNQKAYVQGKTGSCDINGGLVKVEKRWIGFKTSSGNMIVANVTDNGSVSIGVSG